MRQKSKPNHQVLREWNAVYLPFLDADLEMLEDQWKRYEADPAIRSHYPADQWNQARQATDRAREALRELADLHQVDLKADVDESDEEPELDSVTPLWMLAGPNNPERRRADSLRATFDEEIATVKRIVDGVSEEDREKALNDELDAEYLQEQVVLERKQIAEAHRLVRERNAWEERATAAGGIEGLPAPPNLNAAERKALEYALARAERRLAQLEYYCDPETTYEDEYGPALESGETSLARMLHTVPQTRSLIQAMAAWLGLTVPVASPIVYKGPPGTIASFRKLIARADRSRAGHPGMERLFVLLSFLQASVAEIHRGVNNQVYMDFDELKRLRELKHLIPDQDDVQPPG